MVSTLARRWTAAACRHTSPTCRTRLKSSPPHPAGWVNRKWAVRRWASCRAAAATTYRARPISRAWRAEWLATTTPMRCGPLVCRCPASWSNSGTSPAAWADRSSGIASGTTWRRVTRASTARFPASSRISMPAIPTRGSTSRIGPGKHAVPRASSCTARALRSKPRRGTSSMSIGTGRCHATAPRSRLMLMRAAHSQTLVPWWGRSVSGGWRRRHRLRRPATCTCSCRIASSPGRRRWPTSCCSKLVSVRMLPSGDRTRHLAIRRVVWSVSWSRLPATAQWPAWTIARRIGRRTTITPTPGAPRRPMWPARTAISSGISAGSSARISRIMATIWICSTRSMAVCRARSPRPSVFTNRRTASSTRPFTRRTSGHSDGWPCRAPFALTAHGATRPNRPLVPPTSCSRSCRSPRRRAWMRTRTSHLAVA